MVIFGQGSSVRMYEISTKSSNFYFRNFHKDTTSKAPKTQKHVLWDSMKTLQNRKEVKPTTSLRNQNSPRRSNWNLKLTFFPAHFQERESIRGKIQRKRGTWKTKVHLCDMLSKVLCRNSRMRNSRMKLCLQCILSLRVFHQKARVDQKLNHFVRATQHNVDNNKLWWLPPCPCNTEN